MSDAVAFRGLNENESQRLRELLLEEKPLTVLPGDAIEVIDSGPYIAALREAGIDVERMLVVPLAGERSEAGHTLDLRRGQVLRSR